MIIKILNLLEQFVLMIGISSVDHLDLNFANIAFLIWSPSSFYSDDVPQGSITTYHVYIKSKDGFVIADTNTTDTFYHLYIIVSSLLTVILIISISRILLNNTVHMIKLLLNTGSYLCYLFKILTFYIRLY